MSPSRLARTVARWIALVAILAVTFAPSLSGLWAAERGLPWDPVCSATTASAGAASPDDRSHGGAPHAFAHCPYCALHADLAPPPDPRGARPALVAVLRPLPRAFLQAPRANATWLAARPRGPPALA